MEFVIFHDVMDKSISRHLLRKGVVWAKRTDEPISFSERAPDFFKWFNESVMHFDSEEYRQEFWREAYRHGHTIGKVPYTLNDHFRRKNARSEIILANMLAIGLLMGGAFAIWVIRRKIDQHIHRLRRPTYYESERNRRLGLTHERRCIHKRSTSNPCPTADELRNAFKHARDSVENMVRIGSLMEDLECYVDNSLIFGEHGQIIARKGGIRRYIQSEIPDLYDSYKTLMRYKALAKKFRQAVGINDPIPAASVLPDSEKTEKTDKSLNEILEKEEKTKEITLQTKNSPEKQYDENTIRTDFLTSGIIKSEEYLMHKDKPGRSCKTDNNTNKQYCMNGYRKIEKPSEVNNTERIKSDSYPIVNSNMIKNNTLAIAQAILDACDGSFKDFAAILELHIGPDTIPHRLYRNISSCQKFFL